MTEWDGAEYAQLSNLQRAMATEAIAQIGFGGDEQVLDLGCGDGFIARDIAGRVPRGQVVGVDRSASMLAAANAHPGPRFVRADARALPFREHFDVVVSFNALHWVPEMSEALHQIAAVTRPNARVVIQMVCRGVRPSLESVAMTLVREPQWASSFATFTQPFLHVEPERFRHMAVAAGFAVESLSVADREWDFGSRARFEAWCDLGSTAWTDRLSPSARHRFVAEWVDRYQDTCARPGLFYYTQMRAQLGRQHAT